eukprot:1141964-Pelagomonas_calceolata.AAC.4
MPFTPYPCTWCVFAVGTLYFFCERFRFEFWSGSAVFDKEYPHLLLPEGALLEFFNRYNRVACLQKQNHSHCCRPGGLGGVGGGTGGAGGGAGGVGGVGGGLGFCLTG